MRRFLVLSLLLSLLGAFTAVSPAVAQETPSGPSIGEAVPIFGQDGSQVGTVTISNIVEPFESYDTGYDPVRGYHYVLVDVTVSNTATRPITVDPSYFRLIDSDGFIADTAYIYSSQPDAPVFLEYQDAVAPGTDASGSIAFQVFNDSQIERITYSNGFEYKVTVLDQRTELTAAGTTQSVIGPSGEEIAQVTVNGIADPFEDFDEFSAPSRGSRYVMIDVTVVNTSDRTLSVTPSDFQLTDDQGFYLQSAFVTNTNPAVVTYDYRDLAPGEQQTGALYFQVFAGIPVDQITYGDYYTRDLVVADLALGAPTPQAVSSPPATAEIASSPECQGLVEWGTDLVVRIGAAAEVTSLLEGTAAEDLEASAVRDISNQLAAMAQEQRDSNPPAAAVELNTFMTEQFFEAMASATGKIADALESGNKVSALLAVAEAEAVGSLFEDGGQADILFDALETACPAEIETLNNQ